MKTVQIQDNSEALDILTQHNSFAETVRQLEHDEILQLHAGHIAALKLIHKLTDADDTNAPLEASNLLVVLNEMLVVHENNGRAHALKFYGRRELMDAMFTLNKLIS